MTPSRAATSPGWPVEVKSGATIASDWFGALGRVVPLLPGCETGAVVHGGDDRQTRTAGEAVPLADFSRLLVRFNEAA